MPTVKVRVFLVPGEEKNQPILTRLNGIGRFQTEVYACPSTIADVQPTPFLEVEGGQRFYGEEGIKVFFEEEEQATHSK